ncbi:hypothetical protein [Nocardia sp. NPDC047648]|uniref:hypothetical protein n=1 Tax=Nocardia sp. NPDC047648 TaxID=3155625 RepID=UPI0033E82E71
MCPYQGNGSPATGSWTQKTSHPPAAALGRAQWLAEEVLTWAGIDLLILRITALFHENVAVLHAQSIRENNTFGNSFGDAPAPWIAGSDAAELAVTALLYPERFSGAIVERLSGSEIASHTELAGVLSAELGRPVRFEGISSQAWQDDLTALAAAQQDTMINADMAAHISAVGAAIQAAGAPTSPADPAGLERLIGRRPFTFAEFAHEQRELFDPAY